MTRFHCGHPARSRRVCRHLLDDIELDHVYLFTNEARDPALVCLGVCAGAEPGSWPLEPVCDDCFKIIGEAGIWESEEIGVVGSPVPLKIGRAHV